MTERSRHILASYQMRKTRKQKTAFLEFMKREFPQAAVEEGGLFRSRNLVIGDLNSANVVFTAHYDTCAALPFPNLLMPKNILGTMFYMLLICIPLFAISFVLSTVAILLKCSRSCSRPFSNRKTSKQAASGAQARAMTS